MTDDDEHLAVEIAQFVQHVHDIADLLAERMRSLPEAEGEALLEQELLCPPSRPCEAAGLPVQQARPVRLLWQRTP